MQSLLYKCNGYRSKVGCVDQAEAHKSMLPLAKAHFFPPHLSLSFVPSFIRHLTRPFLYCFELPMLIFLFFSFKTCFLPPPYLFVHWILWLLPAYSSVGSPAGCCAWYFGWLILDELGSGVSGGHQRGECRRFPDPVLVSEHVLGQPPVSLYCSLSSSSVIICELVGWILLDMLGVHVLTFAFFVLVRLRCNRSRQEMQTSMLCHHY